MRRPSPDPGRCSPEVPVGMKIPPSARPAATSSRSRRRRPYRSGLPGCGLARSTHRAGRSDLLRMPPIPRWTGASVRVRAATAREAKPMPFQADDRALKDQCPVADGWNASSRQRPFLVAGGHRCIGIPFLDTRHEDLRREDGMVAEDRDGDKRVVLSSTLEKLMRCGAVLPGRCMRSSPPHALPLSRPRASPRCISPMAAG